MATPMNRRILFALLPLLLLAQRPATPQTKTDPDIRKRFIGTWRLVYEHDISDSGQVSYDPVAGPHGIGYLIYAPDGHMCVGLMNPDRPNWKEPKQPSEKDKIALFDSFYAYCGRYEVHSAEHIMMHLPELASTPDYVNNEQPRPYAFDGDRLTFAGKNTATEGGGSYKIVWEKVK
jgi:hypothetical protein